MRNISSIKKQKTYSKDTPQVGSEFKVSKNLAEKIVYEIYGEDYYETIEELEFKLTHAFREGLFDYKLTIDREIDN